LLGLSDPGGVDWGRIRALQFNGNQQHGMLKIVSAIVCSLLIVQWGIGQVNIMILGLWLAAVWALYTYGHLLFRKQTAWQRRSINRDDMTVTYGISFASGLLWGVGFLIFAFSSDLMTMIPVWATVLCLMVGSAMLFSTMPLSSILFISSAGAATVLGWSLVGNLHMAGASLAITVLLISACLMTGRSFIDRRVAEASLTEKSEVVSLLLKEFEDTGADWLWQTDTSRCITHVSPRFAHALGQRGIMGERKLLHRIARTGRQIETSRQFQQHAGTGPDQW